MHEHEAYQPSLAERLRGGLSTAILVVSAITPILWMILSSFKDRYEVTKLPPSLFFTPTLDNYRQLFERTDFLSNTLNSLIVSTGATLLGILLAFPAAFAVSSVMRSAAFSALRAAASIAARCSSFSPSNQRGFT